MKGFLGKKVGNVPANLAGFFRNCILLVHLFQELHRLFIEELCFFLVWLRYAVNLMDDIKVPFPKT